MSTPQNQQHPLHDYYSGIYRRYDMMNRLFTFRQDERWRTITAKLCLAGKPTKILDLCCGTGDLALQIAKHADANVKITGYDFNLKMLALAENKIVSRKIKNITLLNGDAAKMPFSDGEFDAITIGFGFRNLTFQNNNAQKHLDEMCRVLKQGGKLYILESGVPTNGFVKFFYKTYLSLILIPIGGIISGDWKAYNYLAHSSSNFFSLDEVADLLQKSGFNKPTTRKWMFGATNLVIAERIVALK